MRIEKEYTLRRFADAVGLSPSNVTYIEKGVNVPTAEVYQKIITVLNPSVDKRKELDKLYSAIRNLPPPDVCNVLLKNPEFSEKIRTLNGVQLSHKQLEKIDELFKTLKN